MHNLLCIISNIGLASLFIFLEYKDFTKLKMGLCLPNLLGGEMLSLHLGPVLGVSAQGQRHPDNLEVKYLVQG